MKDVVLKVVSLKKTFCRKNVRVCAAADISFEIKKGRCLGLIGESGSGKSTIAQIIAGFERADEGSVFFNDKECLVSRQDFNSRYGMQLIFQNPESSLNPRMKVREILFEAARYLSDLNKEQMEKLAKEVLSQVHLPDKYLGRYPYELSGGECQRVAIARALMLSPGLLICDEITSALDVLVQAQIMDILKGLKEKGISILFITHDLALAEEICDEILVLKEGREVERGSAYDIMHRSTKEYTKLLIDSILTVKEYEETT
ncbi:MAG: dipeptide/oligopeptide/nickel ABC transporter ATP-binding protein [Butyrivibrio sp.]|nr:dipeptide/oligopeptide/nickel ABC transporter ATP-binding protein [Butyrivibrio sp.]